jgi:hypothetical protein
MNDLTLPASLDMGAYEHNEDLARVALRDKALTQALRNAIRETKAREHFRKTVRRNRNVNKKGKLVAEMLTELAQLVDRNLEVDLPLKAEFDAANHLASWPTAVEYFDKLAEQGLIEILARGQSSNHNYHIRLLVSDNAWYEIDRRVNEEMGFRLFAEETRTQKFSPILP